MQKFQNYQHVIVKATLRRESGIDFQTAQAANLVGLSDEEVLALAAKAGRVLVTHDLYGGEIVLTYPRLHR